MMATLLLFFFGFTKQFTTILHKKKWPYES